jgi:hypothetical protein|tara:strand:- start:290 stop:424 length:135 start_codon:yes stop_codon:yes gene_type:complete
MPEPNKITYGPEVRESDGCIFGVAFLALAVILHGLAAIIRLMTP